MIRGLQLGCAVFMTVAVVFGFAWAGSDSAGRGEENASIGEWLVQIRGRAKTFPEQRFANLSRYEFLRRLTRAARTYDFTIRRVDLFHPRQTAPLLIVQTRRPGRLARRTRLILGELNPPRSGWETFSFEGFYFEALDREGRRAFVVWNASRGSSPVGAQWARGERLFPFPHG